MGIISFSVDTTQLNNLFSDIPKIFPIAADSVRVDLLKSYYSFLSTALTLAVETAGTGFPPAYQAHLQHSLSRMRPNIASFGGTLSVDFGSTDALGDVADLEEGYHYQAIEDPGGAWGEHPISNPPRVDLPGPDQALYAYVSKSGDRRQEYWNALIAGEKSFPIRVGPSNMIFYEVPIPVNALERTYIARVRQWGSRYPEWIMLENGWPGNPYINPGHFDTILEGLVADFMVERFEAFALNMIEKIDAGQAVITGGIDGGRFYFRNLAGRFEEYKTLRAM